MSEPMCFDNLNKLANHLRKKLEQKEYILLFGYNGVGKTRLSMTFKDQVKRSKEADTLYFNAFTEDLFYWDNDECVLYMNMNSRLFSGFEGRPMEDPIRPLLHRYVDFDFDINYEQAKVIFFRERENDDERSPIPIKISRGEESIFIWCVFLAIAELAIDKDTGYNWVKYLYIDDPISSLDDNHVISVAAHLSQIFKKYDNNSDKNKSDNNKVKIIISSHHYLFF